MTTPKRAGLQNWQAGVIVGGCLALGAAVGVGVARIPSVFGPAVLAAIVVSVLVELTLPLQRKLGRDSFVPVLPWVVVFGLAVYGLYTLLRGALL